MTDTTSVLVEVDGRRFAVAAAHVHRILEPLPVVGVPFAPAAVEGLIAVDGGILPLIDLGAWLAGRPPAKDGGGQIVVLDAATGRIAVRVARVVGLGAGSDDAMLDPNAIGFGEAPALTESPSPGAVGETAASAEPPEPRTDPFVLMALGGERYALPVDAVREIVPADEVWAMPAAPPSLLGVFYLRGVPLAVLSLASLMNVKVAGGDVFVVLVRDGARFALRVDAVIGLRRFRLRGDSDVYIDDDGTVVTPLDPARLIPDAVVTRFESQGVSEASAPRIRPMRQIVTFKAAGESCALPIDEVERAVEYASPVLVPRTGAGVAEVIEVGGGVVPVIDLRTRIGTVKPGEAPGACLVTRIGSHPYALAIDRLERLATVPADTIETVAGDDGPVTGVGRIDDRPFWLLSASRLVAVS